MGFDLCPSRVYYLDMGSDSNLICYCFGYTEADIARDYRANGGRSAILARVTEAKKNGNCRCEDRHPEKR